MTAGRETLLQKRIASDPTNHSISMSSSKALAPEGGRDMYRIQDRARTGPADPVLAQSPTPFSTDVHVVLFQPIVTCLCVCS